ncbi:NlpC/P60 family protein [Paenibacillus cremeus]|uniref:NlpC/P60 family protein n=2 Tax=Paenibacillus cremeus TaxID=2163881 RepID=A0A559K4N7_9BACL|nr:NlpC/P60 family protein [Paenibacillus cremeus]
MSTAAFASSQQQGQQDEGNGYTANTRVAATYTPTTTQRAFSAPASSSVSSNGIVNTAKSLQGKVRYVFGVRDQSHLIFDCSSYTQYVFQLNGKPIPWGSKAQAHVGTYVPRNQLQPGDLVMFSVSTPGQINHVGIYIGNGQFINNLPHQGVVISNFNSSYWTSHYITGRRV